MIKILSLNINGFGGYYHLEEFKKYYSKQEIYRAYQLWDKIDKNKNIKEILSYIQEKSPDVLILQEFEIGIPYAEYFFREIGNMGYSYIDYYQGKLKRPSITIMFTKKDLRYEQLDNPHEKNLRASVIRISDLIIYGVHIPLYDLDFWDELIIYYKKNKTEKIIIIGDFNVYSEGTARKFKFNELLNQGALDAWVENGYPSETPTHENNRIDYAIVSPSMFRELNGIEICSILKNNGATDHAALIVDIKQNDK